MLKGLISAVGGKGKAKGGEAKAKVSKNAIAAAPKNICSGTVPSCTKSVMYAAKKGTLRTSVHASPGDCRTPICPTKARAKARAMEAKAS